MKKQHITANRKRRRVTFVFTSPQAQRVILMGDFNRWDAGVHPMKKDPQGVWRKIVMLYPGRYEYKFLVDGDWRLDSQNESRCTNCYGSQNNVVHVSAK